MKHWNLYPSISAPMPFQMAFDEILFRRAEARGSGFGPAGPPVPELRFFFSSEPWITVGYSYRGNLQLLKKGKLLPVCRRLTGGGTVEHGKDLIFSIVARKEDDEAFKSVRISYLKIHEAVKEAFARLGRDAQFYRCDENLPKGEECFLFPIATDLSFAGSKIAGGSQKRSSGVLLHEESILLPKGVRADILMENLRKSFEKIFSVQIVKKSLEPSLMAEAKELAKSKYAKGGMERSSDEILSLQS